MRYAEVAVELPVRGTYSYELPEPYRGRALVGARVIVPFGARRVSGVVVAQSDTAPVELQRVRAVTEVIDELPSVDRELLELCLWVADYYEAPPGEVLRAALPVGSRITAGTYVQLTDAGIDAVSGQGAALPRARRELLGRIAAAGGAIAQRKLLGAGLRRAELAALADDGLVMFAAERGKARVRHRTVRVASVARELTDDDRAALARAPKRRAVLDALVEAGGQADVAELERRVPRSAAHLRALAGAGLVAFGEREQRRDHWSTATATAVASAPASPPALTPAQATALTAIREALDAGAFAPFLLHGITGSGKTEVYLHAIADVVAAGGGAIVLVPEISLTPQLAARFRARFGDDVAVLHSGLSDGERFDEWHRIKRGDAHIALGARSAVFAPVRRLGIVVVDEEHDPSFKQEEGVRYHARDVAMVRAQRAGAACVLGSATPSLESFHAARSGRQRLLELPERATPRPLPTVELIDLKVYRPDGDAMLTAPLAEAVDATLARGEQVILFLNRRGFATFVVCASCGHAFRCPHCSVSLTFHRARAQLVCHYCGHAEPVSGRCPACHAQAIIRKGLGTEKVAAAVEERFPSARVARLDRDTASGMGLQEILGRMARREVDILVGTQMVTKGHDFPGVTLVGVLCADTGLSLPDFRAAERTFHLLTQVAGRAGRGDRAGHVLIQTYRPETVAIDAVRAHDFARFFAAESAARRELGYPPFGHLVAVRLDGAEEAAVRAEAERLRRRAVALREAGRTGVTVLGPTEAPLARLKGRTRWHLWLRAGDRRPLRAFTRDLVADAGAGAVRVTVDVDPVSAL